MNINLYSPLNLHLPYEIGIYIQSFLKPTELLYINLNKILKERRKKFKIKVGMETENEKVIEINGYIRTIDKYNTIRTYETYVKDITLFKPYCYLYSQIILEQYIEFGKESLKKNKILLENIKEQINDFLNKN